MKLAYQQYIVFFRVRASIENNTSDNAAMNFQTNEKVQKIFSEPL